MKQEWVCLLLRVLNLLPESVTREDTLKWVNAFYDKKIKLERLKKHGLRHHSSDTVE